MLENHMAIGSPGDYYNTPFDRTPLDTWICPSCKTKWELFSEDEAEQPIYPWEAESTRGYTRLSEEPRLNGCCELCAFKTASCETLTGFVEYYKRMRQIVEEFASEQKWLQVMWNALLSCNDKQSLRDDLAEMIERDYDEDFIDWRAGR